MTGACIYEIKLDGYRALALRSGNESRILSRNQKDLGLEGLIGKRSGSRYEVDKRSGAWVKIKLHLEQEFAIGGYTEPDGARKHFGALLVGFYEGRS